jgi:transcriptional regulator with XRE-family HTH domain
LRKKRAESDNGQRRPRRGPVWRPYPDLLSWRLAVGLTSAEAATVLQLSQTKYSRLERGIGAATGAQAKRLMRTTGVPLEKLVGVA